MSFITVYSSSNNFTSGAFLTCKKVTDQELKHIDLFFEKNLNLHVTLGKQNVTLYIRYNLLEENFQLGEIDLITFILRYPIVEDVTDSENEDDEDY
jgi:hypothetical protein